MRYLESNLPANIHLRVYHLHEGNSTQSSRAYVARTKFGLNAMYPKFTTIAELYKTQDGVDVLLAKGVAACSPKDAPSRSTGRAIAVGRAMKAAGLSR